MFPCGVMLWDLFTAAQAAQKALALAGKRKVEFTAAQAAQKTQQYRTVNRVTFTAAQAAQKMQKQVILDPTQVHCRTGSSEITQEPI